LIKNPIGHPYSNSIPQPSPHFLACSSFRIILPCIRDIRKRSQLHKWFDRNFELYCCMKCFAASAIEYAPYLPVGIIGKYAIDRYDLLGPPQHKRTLTTGELLDFLFAQFGFAEQTLRYDFPRSLQLTAADQHT